MREVVQRLANQVWRMAAIGWTLAMIFVLLCSVATMVGLVWLVVWILRSV